MLYKQFHSGLPTKSFLKILQIKLTTSANFLKGTLGVVIRKANALQIDHTPLPHVGSLEFESFPEKSPRQALPSNANCQ